MSEESEARHTSVEIWTATLSTFFFKLVFALTFAIPVLLLEPSVAVLAGTIWGLLVLGVFSFKLAREQRRVHPAI